MKLDTGATCVRWALAADGMPKLRPTYYPPHQGRRYPCLCTKCWERYEEGTPGHMPPLPDLR